MTDPTPAAGGLTEAEREALNVAQFDTPSTLMHNPIHAAVERIIAARTEAADREVARVTANLLAMADEWDVTTFPDERTAATMRHDLRAALSSAGSDALDRERAKAAAEALREAADRFASDAPLTPQYVRDCLRADAERAAAVSPEGGGEEAVPRCQHVSPSPWGPTQCALPLDHEERHAYDPAEGGGV